MEELERFARWEINLNEIVPVKYLYGWDRYYEDEILDDEYEVEGEYTVTIDDIKCVLEKLSNKIKKGYTLHDFKRDWLGWLSDCKLHSAITYKMAEEETADALISKACRKWGYYLLRNEDDLIEYLRKYLYEFYSENEDFYFYNENRYEVDGLLDVIEYYYNKRTKKVPVLVLVDFWYRFKEHYNINHRFGEMPIEILFYAKKILYYIENNKAFLHDVEEDYKDDWGTVSLLYDDAMTFKARAYYHGDELYDKDIRKSYEISKKMYKLYLDGLEEEIPEDCQSILFETNYFGLLTNGIPNYVEAMNYVSDCIKAVDLYLYGLGCERDYSKAKKILDDEYDFRLHRFGGLLENACHFDQISEKMGDYYWNLYCDNKDERYYKEAYKYYIQAEYACAYLNCTDSNADFEVYVRVRKKLEENYSDISKREIVRRNKPFEFPEYINENGFNSATVYRISDEKMKIVLHARDDFKQKIFLAIPEYGFCDFVPEVTYYAEGVKEYHINDNGDSFDYDRIEKESESNRYKFILKGKMIAYIEADYYEIPEHTNGIYTKGEIEDRTFVRVQISGNHQCIDYFVFDDKDINNLDKIKINYYGMELEADVKEVFSIKVDLDAFSDNKYPHIYLEGIDISNSEL